MGWHNEGPLLGADSETTGIDVESDRIVTWSLVRIAPGRPVDSVSHLIAVDVPIPEAAQAVHGISTEVAVRDGKPAWEVLEEVTSELATAMSAGTPVVTANGCYDLTILDRECRRNGLPTLGERLHGAVRPVIDVMCLDKQVDRYRKGKKTLTHLCEHYRVKLDGAHDSTWDALAAARVAWRICEMYPAIGEMDLNDLHDKQVQWYAEQRRSFAEYRARMGQPLTDVRLEWPVVPFASEAVA